MSSLIKLTRGVTAPLGSSVYENGVNFSVYAPHAKQLYVCLFDDDGQIEKFKLAMNLNEGGIWTLHVAPLDHIASLDNGVLYGYRAEGDLAPEHGQHFNVNKLLIDPYAKDLAGQFQWHKAHFNSGKKSAHMDNAPYIYKSRLCELTPYQGVKPKYSWEDTIIYECHVKGATIGHPEIPTHLRGKYLGLCHDVFIEHLKKLGVTTVELLPVHAFVSEQFLVDKGLKNYWGYNSINFFTPHKDYLVNDDISEFRQMVDRLHQAGIEVILDVVYNHTAESGVEGPVFSWRGLHNRGYYRSLHDNPKVYINDTGCGNTLNIDNPYSLKMVLDSLRYWVEVMGVDGFRFDLATILGRTMQGFRQEHAFFQAINQDPILSHVKLIAEPWDIGPGGYQVGAFPAPWREWNDKYRDAVHQFWRGDDNMLPEVSRRLHGSCDLFGHNLRGPLNSINFITSHDGFTLADSVSYNHKRNELNGEKNQDGHNENYSFNCGEEGYTDDLNILKLRLQQQKNMLLMLLFSKGVPMLASGSEMGHSQAGNNNAYCQDNTINWLAWRDDQLDHPLMTFIQKAVRLRKSYGHFGHGAFLYNANKRFSVHWFNEEGNEMSINDWHDPDSNFLMYSLRDEEHKTVLLIIFNADAHNVQCRLPQTRNWTLELSSYQKAGNKPVRIEKNEKLDIVAHSSWVFSAKIED